MKIMPIKIGYRLLLLGGVYTIYGLLMNILDKYFRDQSLHNGLLALYPIHAVVVITIITAIIYLGIKNKMALSVWGFTLNRGCFYSAGLAILVTPLMDVGFVFANCHIWDPFQILSISIEEIIYRATIINGLLLLLGRRRRSAILAIGLSTIMFMIPHFSTYTFHYVMNSVFEGGIIFGELISKGVEIGKKVA